MEMEKMVMNAMFTFSHNILKGHFPHGHKHFSFMEECYGNSLIPTGRFWCLFIMGVLQTKPVL